MSTNDRPAHEDEIVVTHEMLEAGALALARYTDYFDTLEDGAERIFRAMVCLSPTSDDKR